MERTPMPITRRRRANPPDQPENTNGLAPDQAANPAEAVPTERPAEPPMETESAAPSAPPVPPAGVRPEMNTTYQPVVPPPALPLTTVNGDRGVRQDYLPIEGGRRTARG